MGNGSDLFYPVFKIILGSVCIILGVEYAWTYCVYHAATFGILYVADTFTWLSAGTILLTEGLYSYLQTLRRAKHELDVSRPPV